MRKARTASQAPSLRTLSGRERCYNERRMNAREGLKITGKITIVRYRAGMAEAAAPPLERLKQQKALNRAFSNPHMRKATAAYAQKLKDRIEAIKAAHFLEVAVETPNLIMDSPNYGLDLIVQRLAGNNTYSLNLLWIEIGTGTTAPIVNDTGLATPTLRLPVTYQEDYGATDAIVQAYVTDANLPNGTYGEVGSFVDGTSAIGSGQIFNHAVLSPAYAKVSGVDTTIQIDINVVNS